jgi:hypothetical protein
MQIILIMQKFETTYRYPIVCTGTIYLHVILEAVTIRDAPDTDLAGYPANLKAGYRISGRISGST